ncbi:MAG: AsmA-like C-terminal region-containing protein [Chitinophagales bacterium]
MLKKVLLGVLLLFVLLIGAIVAVPFLFKDEINAALKEEINKNLNAKVDYGSFDLSLIRSFPNFSFSIDDVSVAGIGEFKGDTLAYIKNFRFTLDIMTVINKEKYKILQVILTEPKIHALVTKDGKANWDIAKPSTDKTTTSSESSNFAFQINKYAIEKGDIVYEDLKGKTYASVQDLDFSGSGDVTSDVYDFITKTDIASLTYRSGAVAYLSAAKIKADNTIKIDQKNSKYTFTNNEINVNDLGLLFDGFVKLNKDNYDLDVKFKSKATTFKSILSLIPAIYQKDFADIKTSGNLKLDGFVKGLYSEFAYPGFGLNLNVSNAMFQYPSLPTAVNNINIDAKITKEQGPLDKTLVNIQKLHADIGTDPIDARIFVSTPISDPNIDMNLKGRLNLANVPKLYPMKDLKTLTGLLVADLTFKGRKSDLDKKNYNAVKAAGNLSVTNMVYDSKETPMPLNVSDIKMTFNPQNITLNNLAAKIGKSDYQANGSLENYMAYAFNKGALQGKLNLNSNNLDLNEWLKPGESNTTTTKTESEKYFQVPANIDFDANAKFGKVLYDKLTLSNVRGNVQVKNEQISMNNLYADLLGGNATIGATYNTANSSIPKVNFNYDIKNFDFQETYKFVGMAEKLAPVMKYVQGNFSSNLKGAGSLKEDMSVDYNTLVGDGKVQIGTAKVVGLPILTKIAEVTKIPALQNMAINNAWTAIQFKDGKVNVDPTDLKFGNGYNINLKGANGFDQSIDYDVRFDVPSKELGGATNYLTNMIPKVPGLEFKLPETLNLFLKVGDTMTKPTVKLDK